MDSLGGSESPREPPFEEVDGSEDFWAEADPDPESEQNTQAEGRPEHAGEPSVFANVFKLLRGVVVEENTGAREPQKGNEECHLQTDKRGTQNRFSVYND